MVDDATFTRDARLARHLTRRTLGSMSLGAAASFQGVRLVTDEPTSPHLLVPEVQASFLIAIAEDDDGLTGAQPGTGRARVEPDARTFRRQTLNDGDSNGR